MENQTVLCGLPPVSPSFVGTQGEERATVSALGQILGLLEEAVTSSDSQMLSTAGGTVRTLLRLLRILEFLHPLTPLGVYILSIGLENPQTPVPRVGSLSTSQPKVLFIKRGVPSYKQAFWGSASPREIIAFHMLQASGRSLWSRDFLVQASDLACQSCRRTPKLKLHQAAAKNVPSG